MPIPQTPARAVATFSIVAREASTGMLGVAVASKFFAVGSVVPWALAGVGAIAVQSFVDGNFGRRGLALLGAGRTASETLSALLADDAEPAGRQVAVIDASGRTAAFTGEGALPWAGHIAGDGFSCQGNFLTGPEVLAAVAAGFEAGEGSFTERLATGLAAGDRAGGDKRGRQSAAVLVVRKGGGYCGSDRVADLHADDHPDPCGELLRLVRLQELYFGSNPPEERLSVQGWVREGLAWRLLADGLLSAGDETDEGIFRAALETLSLRTNLDHRVHENGASIDPAAYEHLTGG